MECEREIEEFKEKYQIDHFVCLYSERGTAQFAEIISCRVQLAQYMQDLRLDNALAAQQRRGFELAVDSLDFKAAWKRIGYRC